MLPHIHFTTAFSIAFWLGFSNEQIIFVTLLCTSIDFDIFLSKFAADNNHRILITHWPIFWVLIFLLGFFSELTFWIGLSGIIHLLFDLPDWGLPVYEPFSHKLSPHLLRSPTNGDIHSFHWFLKRYYENSLIRIIEIFSLVFFFISFIFFCFS